MPCGKLFFPICFLLNPSERLLNLLPLICIWVVVRRAMGLSYVWVSHVSQVVCDSCERQDRLPLRLPHGKTSHLFDFLDILTLQVMYHIIHLWALSHGRNKVARFRNRWLRTFLVALHGTVDWQYANPMLCVSSSFMSCALTDPSVWCLPIQSLFVSPLVSPRSLFPKSFYRCGLLLAADDC